MTKQDHMVNILRRANEVRELLPAAEKLFEENVSLKHQLDIMAKEVTRLLRLINIRTDERDGANKAHKRKLISLRDHKRIIGELNSSLKKRKSRRTEILIGEA